MEEKRSSQSGFERLKSVLTSEAAGVQDGCELPSLAQYASPCPGYQANVVLIELSCIW